MQCATHPNIETQIRCSKCEKPICFRCMVETPVGHRCRDCAQLKALPIFTMSPLQIVYACAAAAGLALATGVAWGVIHRYVNIFGFFLIFVAIGIGYVAAEGISRAVNRKRAPFLPWLAGLSVAVGYILGNMFYFLFYDFPFSFAVRHLFEYKVGGIWGLLSAILAVAIAYTRLRV